jgi:hypothetical protein
VGGCGQVLRMARPHEVFLVECEAADVRGGLHDYCIAAQDVTKAVPVLNTTYGRV